MKNHLTAGFEIKSVSESGHFEGYASVFHRVDRGMDMILPGACIAFHSLEDGMVKRDFRMRKTAGLYDIVTKRPVIAEPEERGANPRSRSAKLRVAKRTTKENGLKKW